MWPTLKLMSGVNWATLRGELGHFGVNWATSVFLGLMMIFIDLKALNLVYNVYKAHAMSFLT